MPNDDDELVHDESSKWILRLHPSIEPQSPHLFHYSCMDQAYQHSAIVDDEIVRDGTCPNCREPIPAYAIQEILQEGGMRVYIPGEDDIRDELEQFPNGDALIWANRHWRNFIHRRDNHQQPIPVHNIGMYIPPPPVEERVMERDIPEGCSNIPGMPNPYGYGMRNNRCARTSAEFNDPYKCSISGSNRCILKKSSDRPVGCRFIRGPVNGRCAPTQQGEIDDPINCVISNHNRCKINPLRRVIPQGCVAVPKLWNNGDRYGFPRGLTYKCKPTNNAAHNQPNYCELNLLQNCQKKKTKSYRRR